MSSLPEPHIHSKNKIEVELDLFNYTTLVSTKDYNFFFGRMYFTSEDGSQNMYVYQLALDTLELKKDKGTDYGLSWKSKGVFTSKLKSLHNALFIAWEFLDIKWEWNLIKIV